MWARRQILGWLTMVIGGSVFEKALARDPAPETLFFKDDGAFPNSSRYPLLIYRGVIERDADRVRSHFSGYDWTNSWVNGVYPFHHYHSTSHEVLGVYRGSALLQMGGPSGRQLPVSAGDVLVIPAGVGHQRVKADDQFGVVGAYPDGRQWDLLRGLPGERPRADQNIASLPLPNLDPVFGSSGPVRTIWQ